MCFAAGQSFDVCIVSVSSLHRLLSRPDVSRGGTVDGHEQDSFAATAWWEARTAMTTVQLQTQWTHPLDSLQCVRFFHRFLGIFKDDESPRQIKAKVKAQRVR